MLRVLLTSIDQFLYTRFVLSDGGSFNDETFDDSSIASSTQSMESARRLRPMMEGIQRILCQIEKRESS